MTSHHGNVSVNRPFFCTRTGHADPAASLGLRREKAANTIVSRATSPRRPIARLVHRWSVVEVLSGPLTWTRLSRPQRR